MMKTDTEFSKLIQTGNIPGILAAVKGKKLSSDQYEAIYNLSQKTNNWHLKNFLKTYKSESLKKKSKIAQLKTICETLS